MTKNFAITLVVLVTTMLAAASVRAENTAAAQQTATGTSQAVISPGAVSITSNSNQLPWTAVDQNFHTNQAASAPANIGSTSSGSNTGCPAVDGWSASVVVANGGKTTAQELPGCMLNILGQNVGLLKMVDGKFDGLSVMRLETWCLYPLYKQAIENGMNFKCKATRDEEAKQRAVIVTTQTPGVIDPYKAARGF